MAKWIHFLSVATLCALTEMQDVLSGCSFQITVPEGKRTTCTNVTNHFFENVPIDLNRSQWLTCESCNLTVITRETFPFAKNDVSYLILARNRITALADFAFSRFPALKMLKLCDNSIATIEKRSFSKAKRLLQLDLSRNRLRKLSDNVFLELENLDILNLNENELETLENGALVGLNNLKYLYLNRNRLKRLEADRFWHVPNLKMLYLENNTIEEVHPLAFRKLDNLNYLYLNNNSINYLVQYNFKPLINLIDLQLRFNRLYEIQTSTFNGLKNLKYLYLGQNRLEKVHPYGFVGIDSLQVLDLIGNRFEFFTLDYFRDLDNLSTLWLENNRIDNFTITRGADVQKSLKVLDLIENRLNRFDYKLLHGKMPRLMEIWIGDNPWNCNFAIEMYDYFQNCNVSLCTSTDCSSATIETFIKDLCFENPSEDDDTEEIGTDFTTNLSQRISSYYLIVQLLLFIFKCVVV